MTARGVLVLGSALAGLGVAIGAFGTHAMAGRFPASDLATFETAVRYQMYHAVALVGLAAWLDRRPDRRLMWGIRSLVVGVAAFSGSLYLFVLTGVRWLVAITPLGGVSLILGWILIVSAARSSAPPAEA